MRDVLKPIVKWCEQQRAMYERQLALMENKVLKVGEYRQGEMVDTTDATMRDIQERLEQLDRLLAEYRETE